MDRLPVKICGLTRPEDAREAGRLGAARLGVVFAGGPRMLDPIRARAIVEAAGPVPVVGVFGGQDRDEILRVRDATGIRGVQLHGGGDRKLESALRAAGLEVIRVARLRSDADLATLGTTPGDADWTLVEARVEGRLGGAGVPLALELAVEARQRLTGRRMILAGGLSPENVAVAAAAVRPDAVDVSSGVEQIPGIKDHRRMTQFLEALGWG